jgi:hypothetical protein
MASTESIRLAKLINEKVGVLKTVCQGIDEKTASRAPEGRWSPKEIISHLCGKEGEGFIVTVQAYLDHDTPRIDIDPENPFFTDRRSRMTLAELLAAFEQQYKIMADRTLSLTEEQLARKAHIPLLKDSPMGEYPTLAMWIEAIADYHLSFHIDHLKEILQAFKGV